MRNVLRTHLRFVTISIGLLAWLFFTALGTTSHAIATPFLSPLQVVEPFLSVPYYGPKGINAYVDHDPLGGGRNSSILIFDGRSASLTNGWCDGAGYNPHIAFWTAPNQQGDCLWYDAHQGNDFSLVYEPVLAAADGTVIQAAGTIGTIDMQATDCICSSHMPTATRRAMVT